MRSRQLGMSPSKMAIAVAVTIAATAGTGGMKNVTGTSSAVAMVAVRPGTAPTKRPNTAEARITHSTYHSKTRAKAWLRTPIARAGPRAAARAAIYRKRDGSRSARAPRPGWSSARTRPECAPRARRGPLHPFWKLHPVSARAPAGKHQHHAANGEANGDQAGKPGRAELLARHRRKSLDVPEDRRGERDQRRAAERIMELYLASPTAFSAPPRLASDAAMNFAVSCGSAQITPKPRLAMKSL